MESNDPSKRLITDGESFGRLIRFLESRKVLVFDYETSGLAWYRHAEAVGVGLGSWDDQGRFWAAYVPWGHKTGEQQLDRSIVVPEVLRLLANPNTLKAAHNIKFEDHFTRKLGGIVAGPRYDTMVGARLYDENRDINLEYRAASDLRIEGAFDQKRVVEREIGQLARQNRMKVKDYKNRYGYSELSIYRCGIYGCTDVHHCGGLLEHYERWGLSSRYPRIWPTEMALTEILCDMEQVGLPVDVAYLQELQQTLSAELERIESKLIEVIGVQFDPAKDNNVLWLFEKLGLIKKERDAFGNTIVKAFKKTRTGEVAIDAEVLQTFVHVHPSIQLILDWREAEKLRNTYTASILDKTDDKGIVHGDLQQVGTNTGRLSCKAPNYHNMPAESEKRALAATGKKLEDGGLDPWSIRRGFPVRNAQTPRLFLDYSQIELRVLAWYSRDPVMMNAYLNGEDIHKRTAVEVFGEYDKATRRKAKVINFGLSYCLTDQGFARQANIPLEEATRFLDTFFQKFGGIKQFRFQFWSAIRQNPEHSFNNLFGRTRRLPHIAATEKWVKARAERQAIGTLIQGTAAELTKESLVRISRFLKAEKLPAWIVNNVHDDIQIDADRSCLTYVAQHAKRLMEDYPEFQPMPIITDCEVSETNWAEKKKLEMAA